MAAGDCTITCIGIQSILSGAAITSNLVASGGFLSGAQLLAVACGPQNQQVAFFKAVVA